MSSEKKVRPDAVLKTLPPERQEQIWELLEKETLSAVKKQLADDGIKVSVQTISEFRSWYALRLQSQLRESRVLSMMDLLRKQVPDLPEDKVAAYGASVFNLQAIEQGDADTFLAIQTAKHNAEMDKLKFQQRERQIAQRQETLELDKKKFQRETAELFLKWFEDARVKQIASSGEPKADRTEKLGRLIFGEDWE